MEAVDVFDFVDCLLDLSQDILTVVQNYKGEEQFTLEPDEKLIELTVADVLKFAGKNLTLDEVVDPDARRRLIGNILNSFEANFVIKNQTQSVMSAWSEVESMVFIGETIYSVMRGNLEQVDDSFFS